MWLLLGICLAGGVLASLSLSFGLAVCRYTAGYDRTLAERRTASFFEGYILGWLLGLFVTMPLAEIFICQGMIISSWIMFIGFVLTQVITLYVRGIFRRRAEEKRRKEVQAIREKWRREKSS